MASVSSTLHSVPGDSVGSVGGSDGGDHSTRVDVDMAMASPEDKVGDESNMCTDHPKWLDAIIEEERRVECPHYKILLSSLRLTELQERISQLVACGSDVIVMGPSASGKSVAIRAGLARCHVTVPCISAEYGWVESANIKHTAVQHPRTLVETMMSHREDELDTRRIMWERMTQEVEERAHSGMPSVQVYTRPSHTRFGQDDVKLISRAQEKKDKGRVMMVCMEDSKAVLTSSLLCSEWSEKHRLRFQYVSELTEPEDSPLTIQVRKWASDRGIEVIELPTPTWRA